MRHLTMVLVLFAFCHCLCFSQDIDNSDSQQWGDFKAKFANAPSLLARAKCDNDVLLNGRWQSGWTFEFKSGYNGPVDFIYLVEFGDPQTHTNHMTGPFLWTIAPGQVLDADSELLGKCIQHKTTGGLHITVKCVVPQGQDAPCFKNADGTRVAERPPLERLTNTSKASGAAQKTIHKTYGSCAAQYEISSDPGLQFVTTNIFEQRVSYRNLDGRSDQEQADAKELASWVSQQHPGAQKVAANCMLNDQRAELGRFTNRRLPHSPKAPSASRLVGRRNELLAQRARPKKILERSHPSRPSNSFRQRCDMRNSPCFLIALISAGMIAVGQETSTPSNASACVVKSSIPSGSTDQRITPPYLAAVRNNCSRPVHVAYCAKLPSQKCFACMFAEDLQPGRSGDGNASRTMRAYCGQEGCGDSEIVWNATFAPANESDSPQPGEVFPKKPNVNDRCGGTAQ